MELRLVPLEETNCYNFAEKLYTEAFPPDERRDFAVSIGLVDKLPHYQYNIITANDEPVGILITWHFSEFDYWEHFAIVPEKRSLGIGAQVMKMVLAETKKQIVFEVELPIDEIAKKRVAFYERMGFFSNKQAYFQPAYSCGKKGIPMRIMSRIPLDSAAFDCVVKVLCKNVYSNNHNVSGNKDRK